MPNVSGDLESVLRDHEKRISDLERRPLGCLDFHDRFYVIAWDEYSLPPPDVHGGRLVGYYVRETNRVWAWIGDTWGNTGGDLDDWLPDPTPP